MKYKVVVFDCDGTLINDDGVVTPKTKEAMQKASDLGVKFVFASGRAVSGIDNITHKLGLDGSFDYYLAHNGSKIYSVQDKKVLKEYSLGKKDAILLANQVEKIGLSYYMYGSSGIFSTEYNEQAEIEAGKNGCKYSVVSLDEVHQSEKIYKFVIGEAAEKIDANLDTLQKIATEFGYVSAKAASTNYEFCECHANKGQGIEELSALLQIPVAEMVAFGDSENDISMLKTAGVGVAMGNSSEDVLNIADMVTKDNNHDGIAEAFKKLGLINDCNAFPLLDKFNKGR